MRVPVPDELLPADRARHGCTSSASAAPGCPASPGSCSPAASPSAAATPRSPGPSRRCGRSAPRCYVGHDAARCRTPTRVVVSTAVREDNPEVVEARRRGLRLLPRSAALESVMQGRRVVAVAGTHGKTTTTSLLTVALQHCGADPSFAIGGELNETGSNAHDGSGELFVAEADESDGAFLVYSPYGAAGHQRRGRPPRQLRHRGGLPRGLRHASSTGSTPRASWSSASTTPAPPTSPSRPAAKGLTVVGVGESERRRPAGGVPAVRRAPPRGSPWSTAAAGSARCPCRSPAGTTSSTRSPRWPPACGSGFGFADLRARPRGVHRHPPPDGVQGRGRRRAGLRQLRPPPQRDRRRPAGRPVAGRRGPGRGRLPAAPGLPHQDLRRPRWARPSAPPTRSS